MVGYWTVEDERLGTRHTDDVSIILATLGSPTFDKTETRDIRDHVQFNLPHKIKRREKKKRQYHKRTEEKTG